MHTSIVSWCNLRKASEAIYPKAAIGLALIYIVFYLKKGGFETAPLEITLAGCLIVIFTVVCLRLFVPKLISTYSSSSSYEAFAQRQVKKKFLCPSYFYDQIKELPPTLIEATEMGYRFDGKFDFDIPNLKAALGEFGILTFIARLQFARANASLPNARWFLSCFGVLGLLLMYWRPLTMIWNIYSS